MKYDNLVQYSADAKGANGAEGNFRSGFCAIVGRPNVGKSTLLNRFIGEKVSIVSPKPQTTRNKIAGILTGSDFQIVFEDTPGVIKKQGKLSEFMKKSIDIAGDDTDVLLIVFDGLKGITYEDEEIITKYRTRAKNVFYIVNKTDDAGPERIMPALKRLSGLGLENIYPISARTGENVQLLLQKILEKLPFGAMYYPKDATTDKSVRFMAAEIIREKALYIYQQEIPHGVGVNICKFDYGENQIMQIDAEIFCEKQSHKSIIIGKGGAALKKLGEQSRVDIEKLLSEKVYLTLWVKVKEKWRERESLLKELGYDKKQV